MHPDKDYLIKLKEVSNTSFFVLYIRYIIMERLTEKTRKELINKSINANKTKTYGTTRYDRRNKISIFNTLQNYNKIDMNALFKANLLSFKIPVKGETNNYEINVLFEGICDELKQEVKANNNKLEFKCVYKALIKAIDRQDIYISCTCSDWKYRMAYWSTKQRYNSGPSQLVPAKVMNPDDKDGAGCKHVLNVLTNLEWAVKLAIVINNYIIYMDKHMHDKYIKFIQPKLFDDIDDDLANSMDNEQDEAEINKANEEEDDNSGN